MAFARQDMQGFQQLYGLPWAYRLLYLLCQRGSTWPRFFTHALLTLVGRSMGTSAYPLLWAHTGDNAQLVPARFTHLLLQRHVALRNRIDIGVGFYRTVYAFLAQQMQYRIRRPVGRVGNVLWLRAVKLVAWMEGRHLQDPF